MTVKGINVEISLDANREVKAGDDWWEMLREERLRMVKRFLEACMEADMLEHLRAGRYKRTELRRGRRNGYYHRSLLVDIGLIQNLLVPRDREGKFQPQVLERYQRHQAQVDRLIREMFRGRSEYQEGRRST